MSSILRVCLSSELPAEDARLSNYYYFAYDRLLLYKGSEKITSNYSISDSLPEQPVPNMLYILHDGTIHQYLDYTDRTIATIEDPSQIPNIIKAGTTYFINSDSRYIDKHDRTLVMPFNSEAYELVVDYRDEDIFDNDTIVKYNEDTGQFELYSGEEKYSEYSKELKGRTTKSVKTEVYGSRLNADVRISEAFGNALKVLSDGLFVRSDNKVNKKDFDQYYRDFKDLRAYCYAILDNIESQIEYLSQIISKEAINEEIHSQLIGHYPTIDAALSNYDWIRSKLNNIESAAMMYATNTTNAGIIEIDAKLKQASEWNNITEDVSDYEHEVNYNDKANSYDNQLPNSKIAAVVAAIDIYNMAGDDFAAIATTIDLFNTSGPDVNNAELAAVAVGIDLHEKTDYSWFAAITLGMLLYDTSVVSDSDFAAITLGLDMYNRGDIVSNSGLAAISAGIELYNNEA